MNSPNAELMERYNTEAVFLEKNAGNLPLAARIAAGIVGLGSARSYQREQQHQALQARAMNDQFRLLLAMRMDPTTMGMEHTRVPVLLPPGNNMPLGLTEGMVRLASAAGADMAQMEKDAGIGTALGAVSGAAKALPAFLRASVGKPVAAVAGAVKGSVNKGVTAASSVFKSNVAAGKAADQTRQAARLRAAEASTASRMTAAEVRSGGKATGVSGSSAAPKPAGRVAPAAEAPPPQTPTVGSVAPQPPAPPPAAPPSQGQAPGMVERMGMGNGAWKWKAPAIGAMALGSYGAYRAGKGALNALGRESPPSVYNAGGANSASGINQYGVPDRATSFS